MKASLSSKFTNSRYTAGGTTELDGRYLGWWERTNITFSRDDLIITLIPRYDQRPDLLAKDIYNKELYQWVILQYNNILDLTTEFTTGVTIRAPSQNRLQAILATSNSNSIGV